MLAELIVSKVVMASTGSLGACHDPWWLGNYAYLLEGDALRSYNQRCFKT